MVAAVAPLDASSALAAARVARYSASRLASKASASSSRAATSFARAAAFRTRAGRTAPSSASSSARAAASSSPSSLSQWQPSQAQDGWSAASAEEKPAHAVQMMALQAAHLSHVAPRTARPVWPFRQPRWQRPFEPMARSKRFLASLPDKTK